MNSLKMTFYDWISYLFPGGIFCWFVFESSPLIFQGFSNLLIIKSSFIQGVMFIVISYVCGHFLHAIANFSIDKLPSGGYPSKYYFENQFNKDFDGHLIKKLILLLGDESPSDEIEYIKKRYWLCFTKVTSNQSDSLASLFLAHNGFYRGLTICILLIILLFNLVYRLDLYNHIVISIGLSVFALLSHLRSCRFKNYLTKTVYTDFIRIMGEKND